MKVLFETRKANDCGWKQIVVIERDDSIYSFTIEEVKTPTGATYCYETSEWSGRSSKLIAIEDLAANYFDDTPVPSDPDFYFEHP